MHACVRDYYFCNCMRFHRVSLSCICGWMDFVLVVVGVDDDDDDDDDVDIDADECIYNFMYFLASQLYATCG